MRLPFTRDAFFEVFARYNQDQWLIVVLLWLAAFAALVGVTRAPGRRSDGLASVLMAVLWLWGGLVYHAGYFTRINPVAWGFSSLFVVQGLLLFWYGVGRRLLQFGTAQGPSWWLGIGLAAYALLYPMLGVLTGHGYPASPTFGVPCPTSLLTAGLFITSSAPPPVPLLVVPIAWAMVGGSAAVVLSVPTDYLLLASALLLPLDSLVKRGKGAL